MKLWLRRLAIQEIGRFMTRCFDCEFRGSNLDGDLDLFPISNKSLLSYRLHQNYLVSLHSTLPLVRSLRAGWERIEFEMNDAKKH
jgi:hypothetical protein